MHALAVSFVLSGHMLSFAMFAPICVCFPFIGVIGLAAVAFWIWTIVDLATNEPSQDQNKIVWLLVVIFLHSIGALIYCLVRRPERIRLYGK